MTRVPIRGQGGLALLGVLGVLIVLAVLGTVVYNSVHTDITHSGREVSRVRAEFAAESAVQWGLAEAARKRPGVEPFTLATHDPSGENALGGSAYDAEGKRIALRSEDVSRTQGAEGGIDKNGWIYQSTHGREASISNSMSETLAFKIWYPDDSTLRIQGRGDVDGSSADVDLVSRIRDIAIPME
jgi:hypothetical protein